MIDSKQNFLKGINRRFTREQSVDPNFFYTLQNARIFSRGSTGTVERIKGYVQFDQSAKDYSGTLDMISYREYFIIFYKDGGDFSIDVIDTLGAVEFTDTYSAEDTDEGSLTISDNNIFITPHNKVLYYNQGNWVLTDYISDVGSITGISLNDTSGVAEGTITVSSGPQQFDGSPARGSIRINANNTPRGETDQFRVNVGGELTDNITVEYKDTIHDIKEKIATALGNVTAITDDWIITVNSSTNRGTRGRRGGKSPGIVTLTARNNGSALNGTDIFLADSTYNIEEHEDVHDGDGDKWPRDVDGGGVTIDLGHFRDPSLNITVKIIDPKGGRDATTDLGPLNVRIYRLGNDFDIETDHILAGDTYAEVGQKIRDALDADNVFNIYYNYSVDDNGSEYTITISGVRGGSDLNSNMSVFLPNLTTRTPDDHFDFDYTNITGGSVSDPDGLLETFEDFWYRVRYRYKDGHVTNFSYPIHINTEVASEVSLTIDTSLTDIDGERAQVEIYRKQKNGNFLLIDRVNPDADQTVYVDDGKPGQASGDPKNNIWTKRHNAQAIIDNRLVRGGITYFDERYEGVDNIEFSLADTNEPDQLPSKSGVKLYVKPQYKDGTFGYHQLVDEIKVPDFGKKLQVQQTDLLQSNDKDIHEIGIYGKFIPRSSDNNLSFNTTEISNRNIATIEDTDYYPNRTRILFGFKYLEINEFLSRGGVAGARVRGWNETDNENMLWETDIQYDSDPEIDGHPREFYANIFGIKMKYVRAFTFESDSGITSSVYKLAMFEALKEAAKTRQLRLRFRLQGRGNIVPITGNEVISQLTKDNDNDILSVDVKVTSLVDESLQYPEVDATNIELGSFDSVDASYIQGPDDSRIYLELEESIYDDIENSNINHYGIAKVADTGNGIISVKTPIPFELTDFSMDEDVSMNESSATDSLDGGAPRVDGELTYYRYDWDWGQYDLINHDDLSGEDRLLFLGSKQNEVSGPQDLDIMGFRNLENDLLNFTYPNEFNIYDLQITKEDINLERKEFLNQLVWSGQILESTRYSEERNISPHNFFPVPSEHGRILKIFPLQGRLYVFCERGVLVCMIGETIARQKNDQVVVTDSNFITGYYWIKEDLNDIKYDSIIKKDNTIYFTDGYDVYQIRQQPKNITEGSIPLDPTHDYSATCDDQNDELKISDLTDGVTWVYNYKFQQWYGPFTYVDSNGANLNELVVSVVGGKLVAHNIGNTFDGESFATVIESVANDTEQSFTDKNYRKFYIEVHNNGNTQFRYGKTPDQMAQVQMSDMREVMGAKHQGINSSHQNSKVIYWEIETTDEGFILDDISWKFRNKNRR